MTLFGWSLRRALRQPGPNVEGSASGPSIGLRGPDDWQPTHRHRKGGLYRLLAMGVNEADRSPVAIYDDAPGDIWVRSAEDFNDGRFTPLR